MGAFLGIFSLVFLFPPFSRSSLSTSLLDVSPVSRSAFLPFVSLSLSLLPSSVTPTAACYLDHSSSLFLSAFLRSSFLVSHPIPILLRHTMHSPLPATIRCPLAPLSSSAVYASIYPVRGHSCHSLCDCVGGGIYMVFSLLGVGSMLVD